MKVGDIIDAMDLCVGAWFEAEIVKVAEKEDINNNQEKDESTEEKVDSGGEKKENVGDGISDSKMASNHENMTSNKEPGDVNHSESRSANNEGDGLVYHVRFEE